MVFPFVSSFPYVFQRIFNFNLSDVNCLFIFFSDVSLQERKNIKARQSLKVTSRESAGHGRLHYMIILGSLPFFSSFDRFFPLHR